MNLLVISPAPAIADSLRAAIAGAGYAVVHSSSAKDALAVCAPGAAAAVFVHAEKADAELATTVAELRGAGYLPVYAVSQSTDPEWEERVYLAGASFVFRLPWRTHLLLCHLGSRPSRLSSRPPFTLPAPPANPGSPSSPNRRLLESLHEFAGLLRDTHQPERFTEEFLNRIREALALNRVALYTRPSAASSTAWECTFAAGVEPRLWRNVSLPLDRGLAAWMLEHAVSLSIHTVERFGLDPSVRDELLSLGMQTAVPVQARDEFVGVLLLGAKVTGLPLTNEELELVYLLMLELGQSLQNARLHHDLSRERTFLSTLSENLGSGCAVFGRDLTVRHVNRRMAAACGGVLPGEFSHRALPAELASLVFQVARGLVKSGETTLRTGDVTTLFQVSLMEPDREMVLVVASDITRLAASHTAALATKEKEMLERMGAQFVHDVRNSLTHLSTMAQLLPNSRGDQTFLGELELALRRDTRRILRHADLLHVLSLPLPPPGEPTGVPEAIRSAWQSLCAEQPDIDPAALSVLPLEDPCLVRVEHGVLRRAFFELLHNAWLSARSGAPLRIRLSCERVGADWQLTFEDNGLGFSPDIIASATSPFVTTRNQGLGLGLTLVKKVATESSGTIRLASSPLGGASVTLTLPASP